MPSHPETLFRQCAPHAGLTYQGRYEEHPSANYGFQSSMRADYARQADPPTTEQVAEQARLMQNAYQPAECTDIGANDTRDAEAPHAGDAIFWMAIAAWAVVVCGGIYALSRWA